MNWIKRLVRSLVLSTREQTLLALASRRADLERVLAEGVVLTTEQKTLLYTERRTLLRAMLSREQWTVLASLEKPDRFTEGAGFTAEDADALQKFFESPLWAKVDLAMINWLQQRAQEAIQAAPEQMIAAGKFAHGCRAGFEMTKTISRLAAAKRSEPEDPDAPTAATGLEQHQP